MAKGANGQTCFAPALQKRVVSTTWPSEARPDFYQVMGLQAGNVACAIIACAHSFHPRDLRVTHQLEISALNMSLPTRILGVPVSRVRFEPPIRAELFGVERLEQHAESLAAAQQVAPKRGRGRRLSPRLYDNTRVLTESYLAIVRAALGAPGNHAGGRMAAGQFSCHRRADPRDQNRSAGGILSHAAEADRRAAAKVIPAYSESPGQLLPTPTALSTSRN